MVLPRSQAPELSVPTVGGAQWTLSEQSPENFTLVVVYRGLHCPICKMQLRDLERKLDALAERGVNVVAVSTDSEDKATQSKQDWGLDKLTLGYGLSIETAREWGLFISTGIKQEPAEFPSRACSSSVRAARSISSRCIACRSPVRRWTMCCLPSTSC
jgi:peroxiredoxin